MLDPYKREPTLLYQQEIMEFLAKHFEKYRNIRSCQQFISNQFDHQKRKYNCS